MNSDEIKGEQERYQDGDLFHTSLDLEVWRYPADGIKALDQTEKDNV